MWNSYIYLKVVVTDEKVPEDSGLVEIAQTNHVFNSLIVNILVVVTVMVVMREMTMIMMILIIMIVMPTLMTDVVCCACCVV